MIAPVIALALILTGCGQPRVSQSPEAPKIPARTASPALAQSLLNTGDSVQAAHVYAQLSSTETDPLKRQEYQLLAAELYFDNELYNDGARMFAALPPALSSELLQQRRNIAYAYYAIAQRNPQQAIETQPDPRTVTDPAQKMRILEARARALMQMNNPVQALKTRVQLEGNLTDPASISLNHQRIWAMLQTLDNNSLQNLARTPAGPMYRGWVEYALLARTRTGAPQTGTTPPEAIQPGQLPAEQTTQTDQATYERRLALWRNRYGDHPAAAVAQNRPLEPGLPPINPATAPISTGQIAVLLPLSGQFSELGAAIKTGFLAAFYADTGTAAVKFYDTQSDAGKAIEQYQLAAAEGASLVIGPLNKSAVINLTASNQIIVPTLSLNYLGDDIPGNSNLYQFGLLPEDEARDAANFATLASYQKTLIINADTPIAQRLAAAFNNRFSEAGGETLGVELIEEDTYDYSQQLRKLLAINSSNTRKRRLEQLLDTKIEFEPAIRGDIDVIFMAVASDQARLLRPQLKFHRAGDIPVLSTAMVFSGTVDAKADSDLTGVRYNEIPWVLTDIPNRSALYQSLEPYQTDTSAGFSRLNALGMDAYLLHKVLEQMRLDPLYSVDGKSGSLSLAQGNRIQRRLHWAEFQEGVPVKSGDAIPVEAILPPLINNDI